jgi:hypothetical protein
MSLNEASLSQFADKVVPYILKNAPQNFIQNWDRKLIYNEENGTAHWLISEAAAKLLPQEIMDHIEKLFDETVRNPIF